MGLLEINMIFTPHQKGKTARIPPQTPPAGETQIRMPIRKISRGFAETIPPENCFRKTESALFRHLPEYLEGRAPKEKHPFLFQKKFHPRQIRNARSVFLSGLPRLCEAVAERYERTRQFRATTRSARAISRDCFQNKFEFCTIDTARKRNRILEPKLGRAEGATLMHSPRRIQNPKWFSTLRVAPRLPIQN